MRLHFKTDGFSLVELMVSVAILTLLSTATVFSLNTTRQTEEIRAAARVLAGDIRSVQARALAGQNIRVCPTTEGPRVCEAENPSAAICTGPCESMVPTHYGIHLDGLHVTRYELFGDLDGDLRLSSDREIILRRSLNPSGSTGKITIGLITGNVAGNLDALDLAVTRQSGTMRANACGDQGLPACIPGEPTMIDIRLWYGAKVHQASVNIDTRVGRISMKL